MAYADGLLSTGERIVHREKQHWFVFVWGARYTILAVILAIVLFVLGGNLSQEGASGSFRTILSWVTAILFVAGLALLLWTTLRYLNQEYVLTNRRVLQVEGVVNKRVVDSSLEKINDAVLSQSIFGRIFGFGDLEVLTAAEAGVTRFGMIVNPIGFKKAMLDAKHEYERGGDDVHLSPPLRADVPAAPAAPVTPPVRVPERGDASAATQIGDETTSTPVPGGLPRTALNADELTRTLASLADLRDRGAISEDEYERKKADILGRL